MATVLTSPWEGFLIAFLIVFAIYLIYRSTSSYSRSVRSQDNPYNAIFTMNSVRSLIFAFSFICFALGLYLDHNWPIYIGLGFLAEDLIETLVILYSIWTYKQRDAI